MTLLTKLLALVNGYKTYLVAGLTGLVAALEVLGGHDQQIALLTAVAAAFGVTIRHAVAKLQASLDAR
jgi:hypothetical protein